MMNKFFDVIQRSLLFDGIDRQHVASILGCVSASRTQYGKGDIVILSGDPVGLVGLLLSGSLKIVKQHQDGQVSMLTQLQAADIFAEVFACAHVSHSPVTVQASQPAEVLWMDYQKIITVCPSGCPFHNKLIENLLRLIARKSLILSQKINILSKRTTREKLFAFFEMHQASDSKFTIPYNREELSHYLCVDRSAMSKELCRMRDEGLIRFDRYEFEIL